MSTKLAKKIANQLPKRKAQTPEKQVFSVKIHISDVGVDLSINENDFSVSSPIESCLEHFENFATEVIQNVIHGHRIGLSGSVAAAVAAVLKQKLLLNAEIINKMIAENNHLDSDLVTATLFTRYEIE